MDDTPQLDPATRRAALDQEMYDRLAPAPGVVGVLYLAYAIAHSIGLQPDLRLPVVMTTGTSAVVLLLLHLSIRRGFVPVRRVASVGAAMALIVVGNCSAYLALSGEPAVSKYLMLAFVGAGLVLLSWQLLGLTLGLGWAAFVLIASFSGPQASAWQHFGVGLATATALAVLVHAARIRATLRLAALQAAERQHTQALRAARGELASRVRARTMELEAANAALREEIDERRRIAERLLRYGQALEACTDAIILAELDGRIVDANAALLALCGASDKAELIGRNLVELAAPEDRERAARGFADVLGEQGGPPQEFALLQVNGERVPVEAALAVVHDESGQACALVSVGRDITWRKQMENSLRHNEAYLRTLIEHSTDTILVLDVDGTVLARPDSADNPVGRFGYVAEGLLGRFGQHFVHPDDVDAVATAFVGATKTPWGTASAECRVRDGAGNHRPVELVFCNLLDDPAVAGVMCSVRDLTDRKNAEAELREARDAAEAASQAKSEFLNTMSHELRTPIHAVIGYAEMLDDGAFGDLNGEQREIVQRITDRARDQFELVAAVLDLSAMEAGRLTVEPRPLCLAEVCGEIEREGRKAWSESGLMVEWDVPVDLPDLLSDGSKIKIVVRNLVGNAVKFTPHGSVVTRARAASGGIEIAVSDTGIGIPEGQRDAIFAPFFQLDGSESRRYEGSGLGLHIVKRLLALLGGRIAVESEVGRGSTFHVWLPLQPRREHAASDGAERSQARVPDGPQPHLDAVRA